MEEIKTYLNAEEHDFQAGYLLFTKYATTTMKHKYDAYLLQSKDAVMLVDRLTFLLTAGLVKENSTRRANTSSPVVTSKKSSTTTSKKVELKEEQNAVVEEKTVATLPEHLKETYRRIKEITPLMSTLHETIQNPTLSNEDRQSYANELCTMEDEMVELWNKIDTWKEENAADGGASELDTPQAVMTMEQLFNQKMRLVANIARTQRKVDANFYKTNITKANAIAAIMRDKKLVEEIDKQLQSIPPAAAPPQ